LDDGEYIENPNKEADALIIAAAPELFEIVKKMATDRGDMLIVNGQMDGDFLKLVDAVIAKATGGDK
jgi:hypothetical protein